MEWNYRVIVKDIDRKIKAIETYENLADAKFCFERWHKRFAHYYKIELEATQKKQPFK
jgi:hypothetical protein